MVEDSSLFPHFTTFFSDFSGSVVYDVVDVINNVEGEVIEVRITEEGFVPSEVVVGKGQEIVWRNERKTKSLVYGMREIDDLRSPYLSEGDVFIWSVSELGSYVYVDAVTIGRTGKIIVR